VSAAQDPAALAIEGIEKSFGRVRALAGVDLSVRSGEVHALIGENGAGKSTLMKVVGGVIQPDRGTIRLDGQPIQPATPLEASRAGIGFVHQELALLPQLSVADNLFLGQEATRRGPLLDRRSMRRQAASALEALGA
jgi:ABC-type sugar transport system ATPase subunit